MDHPVRTTRPRATIATHLNVPRLPLYSSDPTEIVPKIQDLDIPPLIFSDINSRLDIRLSEEKHFFHVQVENNFCYLGAIRPSSFIDEHYQENLYGTLISRLINEEEPLKKLSEWMPVNRKKVERAYELFQEVEEVQEDPFTEKLCRDDKVRQHAEIIASIFWEKISHLQEVNRRVLRKRFIDNLEWVRQKYIAHKVILPRLDSVRARRLSPSSGNTAASFSTPKNSPRKEVTSEQKLVLDMLTLKALDAYHIFLINWISNPKEKLEYNNLSELNLIRKSGLLRDPQLHVVLEKKLAKSFRERISGEKVFADIVRTMEYISITRYDEVLTVQSFANPFDHFSSILNLVLVGLGIKNKGIINQWDRFVADEYSQILQSQEESEIRQEFVDIGKKFFNWLMLEGGSNEKNMNFIMGLLRQQNYTLPLHAVSQVLKWLPLDAIKIKQLQLNFKPHKEIEYRSIQSGVIKVDQPSCPPFTFQIISSMSSSLDNIDFWTSKLRIIITASPDEETRKRIKALILAPMSAVGLKVKMNWVQKKEDPRSKS